MMLGSYTLLGMHTLLVLITVAGAWAQDPQELVRRSIAQNQLDWVRMKDYTWQAHSVQTHLDSHGKVEFTKRETWETLMLYGQPYRRTLERDGKALSQEEQRGEQKKLDRETGRLSSETPSEKQRRKRKHVAAANSLSFLKDLTCSTCGSRANPQWTDDPSGWSPARLGPAPKPKAAPV